MVEIQLARDSNKLCVWPYYLTSLHLRLGCPVRLVVVTLDRAVVRWCAQPIPVGPGFVLHPQVLGPENLPRITDIELLRTLPNSVCSRSRRTGISPARNTLPRPPWPLPTPSTARAQSDTLTWSFRFGKLPSGSRAGHNRTMLGFDIRRQASSLIASLALGLLALGSLTLESGCRTDSRVESAIGTEPAEENRFPHALHRDTTCTECHASSSVLAGVKAMPGADDHAPCDRGNCHRPAFLQNPGPLCRICHRRENPTRAGESPLAPYPRTSGRRALAARFAHDKHLDFALMERNVGFHITCADCHTVRDQGEPIRPGHAVCGRCHAPEAARGTMPAMNACDQCHRPRTRKPTRTRRVIVGDLRFAHSNHQSDVRGRPIRCVQCHQDTREVQSVTAHPDIDTGVCVECHDDSDRTPSAKRMRVCGTCHSSEPLTFGLLAPRSHLPRVERPEDHTLAFRRGHGEDARQNAARCARCHTFMSGAPRDVCDECHQIMRPRDHGLSWREFDHGPEASAQADACATCHKGTFCTSCHSRMPRSHLPRAMFAQGGHGMDAKINLRACITCHDPDGPTGCRRSGCHDGGGGP